MMKLGAKPKKGIDDVLCDEAVLVLYVISCRVDEKENINNVEHKTSIIDDKAEAVQEVKDTKGELKNEINPHALVRDMATCPVFAPGWYLIGCELSVPRTCMGSLLFHQRYQRV